MIDFYPAGLAAFEVTLFLAVLLVGVTVAVLISRD